MERVARYSGRLLTKEQMLKSKSRYILQITKDLYLDAESPKSMEGRTINCARRAGKTPNVRFPANRKVHTCSHCGLSYVYIFARFKLNPSDASPLELIADYEKQYHWDRVLDSIFFTHDEAKHTWPERKITSHLLIVAKIFSLMYEEGIDEESIDKKTETNFPKMKKIVNLLWEKTKEGIYFVENGAPFLEYQQCLRRFIRDHLKVVAKLAAVFYQQEPVEELQLRTLQWWARRVGFTDKYKDEPFVLGKDANGKDELQRWLAEGNTMKQFHKANQRSFYAGAVRQFFQQHCDDFSDNSTPTPSLEFFHFLRLTLITYRQKGRCMHSIMASRHIYVITSLRQIVKVPARVNKNRSIRPNKARASTASRDHHMHSRHNIIPSRQTLKVVARAIATIASL